MVEPCFCNLVLHLPPATQAKHAACDRWNLGTKRGREEEQARVRIWGHDHNHQWWDRMWTWYREATSN